MNPYVELARDFIANNSLNLRLDDVDKIANTFMGNSRAAVVAYLHCVPINSINRKCFPKEIMDDVEFFARRCGETYLDYILRIRGNDICKSVLIAYVKYHCGLDDKYRELQGDLILYILRGG